MSKLVFMLVLLFVADSLSQHIILPTWRPPPSKGPIIRSARAVTDGQALWLYQGDNVDRAPATGDHPYLPNYVDDIKIEPNRRYARSVDSPSARRSSGSRSTSGSHDTGPTHPGYNRRNARSLRLGTIGTPQRGGLINTRHEPPPTIPVRPRRLGTHA